MLAFSLGTRPILVADRSSIRSWRRHVPAFGVALLVAIACSGCASHLRLQRDTVAANFTVSDMYHQQVLNNVARFEVNAASMPSFSVIAAGTVNISDQVGAGVSPTYSPTLTQALQGNGALPILSILFSTTGQRTISENWSTSPVTDSDNLRRMRCAFQLLVGEETSECGECAERLKGFFLGGTESFECMMPRGWYHVGCKEDVPECACYVAQYCDTYVWVMRDGLDGLARFTITVLDIATGEVHTPQHGVKKTYKGEPKAENLETTEITSTEVDHNGLKNATRFQLDRKPPDNQAINRGLFFVE
jgi:hypothetical protein